MTMATILVGWAVPADGSTKSRVYSRASRPKSTTQRSPSKSALRIPTPCPARFTMASLRKCLWAILADFYTALTPRRPPSPSQANWISVRESWKALDLATALHSVTYQSGGITFRREAFVSHPDQVMVLKFSADRPGACTGTVQLRGAHKVTTAAAGTSLTFAGSLNNGLKYEAKLLALNDGGTLPIGRGAGGEKGYNSG